MIKRLMMIKSLHNIKFLLKKRNIVYMVGIDNMKKSCKDILLKNAMQD